MSTEHLSSYKHQTAHHQSIGDQSLMTLCWSMMVIAGLALTLRPTLTSTGPLLGQIRASTGISLQVASLLVVLPMLCMGIFPLLLPWLGRRLSESSWISGGLIAIALSGLWRLEVMAEWTLIASTLLGGIGIAIVQTMTPGVVKRWFPERVPLAMGIYSAALMTGGGVAAIVSPLVASHYGSWQVGLGVWLIVPVIALGLWWFRVREPIQKTDNAVKANFFKRGRAWLLASYFGLANAGYACMIAWLPSYAQGLGWSAAHSGELIGFMTIFQVIGAFGAPILSAKRLDRRRWLYAAVGIQVIGFIGMLLLPQLPLLLWVALIGLGLGACFSLTLTVALDHLSNPRLAGALTAFVQGIGFIITAIVPYVAGFLREWRGSFQAVWVMLLITSIGMLLVTIKFNPSRYNQVMKLAN